MITFSSFYKFQIFREHCIDGSALVVLSETHMTRILGMKLGPAFRLRSAITELMNRTTSPSFCITNWCTYSYGATILATTWTKAIININIPLNCDVLRINVSFVYCFTYHFCNWVLCLFKITYVNKVFSIMPVVES